MTKTIIHFFLVILTLSGLSLQAQKRILYNLQVTYPEGLKRIPLYIWTLIMIKLIFMRPGL